MKFPIRMAQYGTKHGHADGKLAALRSHTQIELAGVYEPDTARQALLRQAGWPYADVYWYQHAEEMLADPTIAAIAAEGRNNESLLHAEAIINAGKHLWYDKPAGDDLALWQRVLAAAKNQQLAIQMGYMFRYHHGFRQLGAWVQSGLLGQIYAIRAHMSTSIPIQQRQTIAAHQGGIFFDLGGHMIDQIVGLLGRPGEITSFIRNDTQEVAGFADNTLAVLQYPQAYAMIDIAAMEAAPPARRFEIYGTQGSAIMEPFEPAPQLRLCLTAPIAGYSQGEQQIMVLAQSRQELYALELAAFLATITGQQPPERSLEHEFLVQETLLRATKRVRS
jgi:predicted dehydrogenase